MKYFGASIQNRKAGQRQEVSMRHPLRILSIEDDPTDAKLIQDLLEAESVVCEVRRIDTQAALMAAIERGGTDLILWITAFPHSSAFRH
jgi:PleD family two-component response regulator